MMNNRINSIFQIQPEVYFRSFHSYNTSLNHLQNEAENSLKAHANKYHLVMPSGEIGKLSNGLYYKGIDQLITEVNISLKSYYEETSQLMRTHDVSNLYMAFARDIENVIKKSKEFKYGSLYSDLLSDSGYLESAFRNVSSLPDESYVLGNRNIQSLIPSTNVLFDNSNKDVLNTLLSGIGNVLTGVAEIITLDFGKGLKHILDGITDIASDTIDNFFGNIKTFLENTPGLNELINKSPLAKSIWDIAFKVGQEVATYLIFQGLDKLVKAGKISETFVKGLKVFEGKNIGNRKIDTIRDLLGYSDFQEDKDLFQGIEDSIDHLFLDKSASKISKFLHRDYDLYYAKSTDIILKRKLSRYQNLSKNVSSNGLNRKQKRTLEFPYASVRLQETVHKIQRLDVHNAMIKASLKGLANEIIDYENDSSAREEADLYNQGYDFESETQSVSENIFNSYLEESIHTEDKNVIISIKGNFREGMLRDQLRNHFGTPN